LTDLEHFVDGQNGDAQVAKCPHLTSEVLVGKVLPVKLRYVVKRFLWELRLAPALFFLLTRYVIVMCSMRIESILFDLFA